MSALPTGLLVSALLKRVNDAGGMGMVRARGDAGGGSILLILNDNDGTSRIVERSMNHAGRPSLIAAGSTDMTEPAIRESYWRRRCRQDPDLWVVELDIASPERFAAETILGD